MNPQVTFPILRRDFQKWLGLRYTSVVNQHVDSAELASNLGHPSLDLRVIRDIDAFEKYTPSFRFYLFGGRTGRLRIDLGKADVGTLACKRERHCFADAPPRTCDQHNLILELHVCCVPSSANK